MNNLEDKMLKQLALYANDYYPEGFNSLINTPKGNSQQICYVLVFKIEEEFKEKYYQNPKEKKFFGLSNGNEINFSMGKYTFDVEDEEKEINSKIKEFIIQYNTFKSAAALLFKSNKEDFKSKYGSENLEITLQENKLKIFKDIIKEKESLLQYEKFFYEFTPVSKEDILKRNSGKNENYPVDFDEEVEKINLKIKEFKRKYNLFRKDAKDLFDDDLEKFESKFDSENLDEILELNKNSIFLNLIDNEENKQILKKFKNYFMKFMQIRRLEYVRITAGNYEPEISEQREEDKLIEHIESSKKLKKFHLILFY